MAKPPKSSNQRALVVGISNYVPPITKLPAVAADVREMAKLLTSKGGTFAKGSVAVLTDAQATQQGVLDKLGEVFQAAADEAVFVYLAGHGGVDGGEYYFVPHDVDSVRLSSTGVPLTTIKTLFDSSPSRQVCLWLDFCHSGGILARGSTDDRDVIKRTLHVVQGEGKFIYAACSPAQFAYEDPTIGHGLFTHALLEGLKGAAATGGEITVNSLYDHMDRHVGSHQQRPEFFGHLKGRMVLIHDSTRSAALSPTKTRGKKGTTKSGAAKTATKKNPITWVLLDKGFFAAQSVRHVENTITLQVTPANGEEEAHIANLKPTQFRGSPTAFSCGDDAAQVRVEKAESEVVDGQKTWTLSLLIDERAFGNDWTDSSYNFGGNTFTSHDIASMRASRILLNDPLPKPRQRSGGIDHTGFLESLIQGSNSPCTITESPIRTIYAQYRNNPAWKQFARLLVVYSLKATGTVEGILKLELGSVRAGAVKVSLRGRRRRYASNVDPTEIVVEGVCPLN